MKMRTAALFTYFKIGTPLFGASPSIAFKLFQTWPTANDGTITPSLPRDVAMVTLDPRKLFARRNKNNRAFDNGEASLGNVSGKSNDTIVLEEGKVLEEGSKVDSGESDEIASLSPKAAFHKFDADSSGDIDEDEFFHLLRSIGIEGNEEYQERLFRRFVKSGSQQKTIDYDGFKSAWLLLGNPKRELIERGVENLPKFATRHQLVRLLERTLDEEERVDALAKAEADRYRRLRDRRKVREEYIGKAKARAGLELGAALDVLGQVYVLGKGAHGQFDGRPKPEMSTSSFRQVGFDRMQTLWEERVEAMVAKRRDGRSRHHGANGNTAGIWGRRPRKVVLTDNTILALTDSGLLSWGGTSNWHHVSDDGPTWKASSQRTQTTPRSSALLMNDERMHRKHLDVIEEEANKKDAEAAHELDNLELVLKYYSRWPSHFEDTNDLDMVREHVLANVSHDQASKFTRNSCVLSEW